MKNLLFLLTLVTQLSCLSSINGDKLVTTDEKQIDEMKLPQRGAVFISNHGNLDKTKFPHQSRDTINQLTRDEFQALPIITGSRYYEGMDGRYFCDRSFSNQFNSYILATFEGGDCGTTMVLVNCKGDSVMGQKVLSEHCAWEHENRKRSAVFQNDSTFIVTVSAEGTAIDSLGNYLIDSLDYLHETQKYRIKADGLIQIQHTEKKRWRKPVSN